MKMLKVDIPSSDNNDPNRLIVANEKIDLSAAHLIFSYLAHHCYYETAEAFLAQWLGPAKETLSKAELLAAQTLQYRSHLKNLILDGHMAEALQYMGEFFPQLLGVDMQDGVDSKEDVDGCLLRFKLLCQQFVEMVRGGESTTALEFIESSITPLAQNRPILKKHLEHLLAMKHREELADSVNSAILKQSDSDLETILRQLVLLNMTSADGHLKNEIPEEGVGMDLSSFLNDIVAPL